MIQQEPHRSIQDIIPPARSKPVFRAPSPTPSGTPPPPVPPTPPQPLDMRPDRPKGVGFALIVAAGVLIVLGVVLGVTSTLFHRAYISVTPYRYTANVEFSFEASPQSPTLPYDMISVEDTATNTIPATGSRHVENHSSGIITVYNSFSTKSERLITNTRFQTKDGLVYRVHAPIVVPGYVMKAGVKVPGTIDVTVYADEAGTKYNIGASDFTLPGLKDPQQAKLIFAKSKIPMAGGFVGEQAVVDPSVRSQAVETLKADLARSLREKILALVPPHSLVFDETIMAVYSEGVDAIEGENAVISVTGRARVPAFPNGNFASVLAQSAGIAPESALTIENPDSVSVHVNTPDAIGSDVPLTLTVSGSAMLVSVFNTEQLAKDLAGKSKSAVHNVLPGYPGISDIVVKVYPFWRSVIPENPKDIKIEILAALDLNP